MPRVHARLDNDRSSRLRGETAYRLKLDHLVPEYAKDAQPPGAIVAAQTKNTPHRDLVIYNGGGIQTT